MLVFSLYPTDEEVVLNQVVQQAKQYNIKHFFVSLHIPETERLQQFIDYMQKLHRQHGYQFFADISPNTLTMLNIPIAALAQLKEYGVIGLRIDFGFTLTEIRMMHQLGFKIALNASTLTEAELMELADIPVIAWHNYYPRPETGLNDAFYQRQNRMISEFRRMIFSFIPGNRQLRAPLHLGLPVLEVQRNRSPYINYLEQRIIYGIEYVAIAEGTISEPDMQMIAKYEAESIITIPVATIDEGCWQVLKDKHWTIRIEESDASWRIKATRHHPDLTIPSHGDGLERVRGALQMDTAAYGRYSGEIHVLRQDLAGDERTIEIGRIAEHYCELVDMLGGRARVEFKKI
ncbi:MupG family TIM beta-alpha barrel fold protein [Culicoidibacter larvae]|uniref:DUF871 domain-containing protein n=1 Tax=Culicoidibacter larvae TaxID=2579976 RepID=A0A5R8QA25_9FIRM|nr:MupG family TIM beta-alpha barrel fold protein [Culicoidibacter larvae]TLG72750.1 DUF871 domain-containing protein [Culicoidibacter larvae]